MPAPASPTSARRPGRPLWALCAIVFCLPFIGSALRKTRMVNDVETWLPAHDAGAQVLAWTQAHFEPENRFLISWDSSTLADPRVAALAERLRPSVAPSHPLEHPLHDIEAVVTPERVLTGMIKRAVPPEVAIERLTGVLIGAGGLKVRLTDAGRKQRAAVEQQLLQYARDSWQLELTIAPPLEIVAVPIATAQEAAPAEVPEDDTFHPQDWRPPPHDFQVQSPDLQPRSPATEPLREFAKSITADDVPLVEDCFFAAGAPVALSVSVQEEGDDRLRATVQAVRDAARAVGIPPEELRLGGSPIGRIELNTASFKSLWNVDYPWWQFYKRSPFALSAIVGTVLAFVLLRSVRLALLVLFTAGYTAAATVALVPATGQSLNSVLVVMPNLMMVVTMSSLIHLANYWRHAAVAGAGDPVEAAVRTSLEPTLLAGVTTAIGLASLVTSVLLPVRQFGLYSAAGCVLALGMVLWVFPALLRLFPGRPAPLAPPHENAWHWFGLWVARHRKSIGAVCLVLYGVAIYGLMFFRTETKVIRYFPPSARIVQDYQFLEDHLAGIVGIDVILRFPPEPPRRSADDEPEAPAAPALAAQPHAVQLDLFQRLQLVQRVQQRLQQIDGVSGAMSLADFRHELDERPAQVTAAYNRSLQVAKKRIFETSRDDTREFVTHAESPLSVELRGIPTRIEVGEEVWRVRAQCSVLKDRHYADFLNEIDSALDAELRPFPGVDHLITGMVPLFLRTQEALLESLINSFGVAFLTIAAVMMYQMRSVAAGALVMLPNILPIALTFGLISWYGIPLDVGTMITASIAMGIAVDSELHFVTWFKQSLQQGMSQDEAVAHGLVHCGPAMWQSCLVIALALQMLMFADLLMISRFGWLMAAMIIVAMLADLFFMPALLAGIMGRIIRRQMPRETIAQAHAPVTAPKPAATH